ncbi:TPA: hypothetical protein ACQQWQ_004633 [Yersinia enterocolitica]
MNNIEELKSAYRDVELTARNMRGKPEEYRVVTGFCPVNVVEIQAQKIQALIAQLEEAQKERDALREVHIGAGSNTRAAADIYFQLVEELEVPAGDSLVGVIDNLKAELSAANEKPIQITLGAGDVMISHIKWPDAQGISFAPMPTGYTGIGLNIDEQVSGKNSGEIGANVIIKSSSIESLKVLRDIVLIAIAGFTVEGNADEK